MKMKKYRKFFGLLLASLVLYCLFNVVTWHLFTAPLLASCRGGGDLARIGYISGSTMPRQVVNDLPLRHLELADYRGQRVDLITLGDSFSHGGGEGRNPFYQDYLASAHNLTVLNLPQYRNLDNISTISILNNNGFLDQVKPRYVLIEASEKYALAGLPPQIDFSASLSGQELQRLGTVTYGTVPDQKRTGLIDVSCFSQANFKLVRNSACYLFSDRAIGSPVYRAKLDRPFFSVANPATLLFLDGDLKSCNSTTPEKVAQLNDYLNQLSDRLAGKGITLIYMPCVDKYDLYRDFIVNNHYPGNIFFDQMRKLPRRYLFVDTKAQLQEELHKGEKDIFYADDTHWSWKASKKISESLRLR